MFSLTLEALDHRAAFAGFQKPSSLPKKTRKSPAQALLRSSAKLQTGFGANGVKVRPHWRHIVLLAAAYSICLKPQCGHSTLTFAGDGLATGILREDPSLVTRALRMLPSPARWTAQFQGAVRLVAVMPAGDFRFADKGCTFFDDQTRRLQVSLQHALAISVRSAHPP